MYEPFHDEDNMNKDDMNNIQLIINLLNYSKKLEGMVIELREEVNELTPEDKEIPYFELHSDIYESFLIIRLSLNIKNTLRCILT